VIAGVPYDAELEYLESTGTQYIDTGVKFTTDNARVKFTASVTYASDKMLCGSQNHSAENNYGFVCYLYNNAMRVYMGTSNTGGISALVDGNVHIVDLQANNGTLTKTIDGTTSTASYGGSIVSGEDFSIFTNWKFATSSMTDRCVSGKIYSFQIWNNGVLVRDMVPVRVGTTGYLYDRVTRRLFGNMGTGSFVLGPDVATPAVGLRMFKPTARSYVQEGLVAMWDGIENAGWGVHDPNATTWKELVVGGANFPLPTLASWRDDGLYVPDVQNTYIATNPGTTSSYVSSVDTLGYSAIVNARTNMTLTAEMGWHQEAIPEVQQNLTNPYNSVAPFGFLNYTEYSYSIWGVPPYQAAWRLNPAATWNSAYWRYYNGGTLAANTDYHMSFAFNGIDENGRFRGEIYSDGTIKNATGPTTAASNYNALQHGGTERPYTFRLNASSATATGVLGKIRFIRLYSRALTASEIAANYAIDKVRFNLP